jgi:hypothetical protein
VQPLRFDEVREGLHQAIAEMEAASTYLKKLGEIVSPEMQVDEMYQRIHEVVGMLQNAVHRSWSYYAEQSPSPPDCWEHTLEQVQLEKELEQNRGEAAGHIDHDGDCCDWRHDDDSSWEESLIDSEELNDHHAK